MFTLSTLSGEPDPSVSAFDIFKSITYRQSVTIRSTRGADYDPDPVWLIVSQRGVFKVGNGSSNIIYHLLYPDGRFEW